MDETIERLIEEAYELSREELEELIGRLQEYLDEIWER